MSHKKDPRYFVLGTKPTKDDIHISGTKLPTRKAILLAFISRKEYMYENDNSKTCIFNSAKETVIEEIVPFYEKARIPSLSVNLMARKIVALYENFKGIQKINIKRRNTGKPKERIENFKINLEMTMPLWDPNSLNMITNEEDKKFLISMQTDRKASMAGIDKKLSKTEQKVENRKFAELRRIENEKKRMEESKSLTNINLESSTDTEGKK